MVVSDNDNVTFLLVIWNKCKKNAITKHPPKYNSK